MSHGGLFMDTDGGFGTSFRFPLFSQCLKKIKEISSDDYTGQLFFFDRNNMG
jgi:hypothetical protein